MGVEPRLVVTCRVSLGSAVALRGALEMAQWCVDGREAGTKLGHVPSLPLGFISDW